MNRFQTLALLYLKILLVKKRKTREVGKYKNISEGKKILNYFNTNLEFCDFRKF